MTSSTRKDLYEAFVAWKKPETVNPVRIFNEFPTLLSTEQCQAFGGKLIEIFNQLKPVVSFCITDPDDRNKLEEWMANIIRQGCVELLDGYGNLQWRYTKFFGWENMPRPLFLIRTESAVCSFMATANEQITGAINTMVIGEKRAAIYKLINEAYPSLVTRIIAETQKKNCDEEAYKLGQWLISKEEMTQTMNAVVFTRLMQSDFGFLQESVSRKIKISFWLNVMDCCVSQERSLELFLLAWKVFALNFDVVKDRGLLFERQLMQYQRCNTMQMRLGRGKRIFKKSVSLVSASDLETQEDFSALLMNVLCEHLCARDKDWVVGLAKEKYKKMFLDSIPKSTTAKIVKTLTPLSSPIIEKKLLDSQEVALSAVPPPVVFENKIESKVESKIESKVERVEPPIVEPSPPTPVAPVLSLPAREVAEPDEKELEKYEFVKLSVDTTAEVEDDDNFKILGGTVTVKMNYF